MPLALLDGFDMFDVYFGAYGGQFVRVAGCWQMTLFFATLIAHRIHVWYITLNGKYT